MINILLSALAIVLLSFGYSVANPLGSPACRVPSGDNNCVYWETFEDSSFSTYGVSQQGVGNVTIVTPGLNGTGHAVRHFWPTINQDILISNSIGLTRTSGQKFWISWYQRYSANFRWAGGPGSCGSPPCSDANSSHKEWDLRGPGPGGRFYIANDSTPLSGGFCNGSGSASGLSGCPHIQIESDPDAGGVEGHFFFLSPFQLQPGTTYHYILEITNGFKSGVNGATVGGFRMWANGAVLFDRPNVGTCGNSNGTCTWQDLFIGGQHAGVGAGGHSIDYDEILVTTTDISPGGGTDTTPPTAPSGLVATAAATGIVNLMASAATDNVGVTAYRWERCQSGVSCPTFTEVIPSTTTASTSDSTVSPSVTYQYRVRAQDAASNLGPYSNIATVTTLGSRQVTVHWTPGTGHTSQVVQRCTGSGCLNFTDYGSALASDTTFIDFTSALPVSCYRVMGDNSGQRSAAAPLNGTCTDQVQTPTPILSVAPPSLTFTATVGGPNPQSQTLGIVNNVVGSPQMNWTVAKNQAWITSLVPSAGADTAPVTVNVSISGLTAGTYNALITVTAPGATNSPVSVPVQLQLAPSITPNAGRSGRLR